MKPKQLVLDMIKEAKEHGQKPPFVLISAKRIDVKDITDISETVFSWKLPSDTCWLLEKKDHDKFIKAFVKQMGAKLTVNMG